LRLNCRITACGNEVVTAGTGEQCDDGNTVSGDCCDAACQVEPGGSSCDNADVCDGTSDTCDGDGACIGAEPLYCDDVNACTRDGCDATLGCTNDVEPATTCRTAAKSSFSVSDKQGGAKDTLKWKWSQGEAVTQPQLGDPDTTTTYTLCIYDRSSGATSLSSMTLLPNPLWDDRDPKGWSYQDKTGTSDGIQKIQLGTTKPGTTATAKAALRAKGLALPTPTPVSPTRFFAQDPSLVVQLHNSEGKCWMSRSFPENAQKNSGDAFKAKSP
jgi:cysteine-rich repeat protein